MMVIRPVEMDDLDNIVALAGKTGTGLTTLPNSRVHLATKIENSLKAFARPQGEPLDECYLFVLEDTKTGSVVGTSGIVAAVGTTRPFYTYKINTEVHYSISMDMYRKHQFLTLTNDFTGSSEICTLFLSPDFRGGGNGILLSRSRFLFMAQFPKRFGLRVVAEMRGESDESGHSPFWECVGRHYFGVDFQVADKENGEGNSQFIAELMPHHPIYVPMLSEAAQRVLGKVHPQTMPAIKMLKAEGFRQTGYIDIFDAGPTIESPVSEVRTVKESFLVPAKIGELSKTGLVNAMLSNTRLNSFRACNAKLSPPEDNSITISPEMAAALLIETGDSIRVKFY
jgi:arginine N-succinyltransferase